MIVRIRPEQAEVFRPCLTQEVLQRLINKKELGIGALTPEGDPQGVLTVSVTDGIEGQQGRNTIIEYFYVLPKYRRQGVFKDMLAFVRDKTKEIKGTIVQVIVPDMEKVEQILMALEFERLDDGNDIITLPIGGMEYSSLTYPGIISKQDDLIPLDELVPGQREVFLKAFGKNLPEGLKPENIPGELLLDHSFVYLTNSGAYGGFLLASTLSDGTLYLGSMFVEPEYRHMAPVLLSALFTKATAPDSSHRFKRIMYATASPEAGRLSEHLLSECDGDITIKHTHNYYKEF